MAIEVRNYLHKTLPIQLPATLLFDYPSLAALTSYLVENLFAAAQLEAEATLPLSEMEQLTDLARHDEGQLHSTLQDMDDATVQRLLSQMMDETPPEDAPFEEDGHEH
jgi:hypothetical protein